jgi:HAUS augmin-like complex subunit 1
MIHGDLLAEDLLHAIDAGLSKEGLTALDAMADVALALDMAADPTPALLGHRFVELQGRAHEVAQLGHRVGMLQSHLDAETARLSLLVDELRHGAEYQLPPPDVIEKQNTELERTVRTMSAELPGLTRQVESLEKTVGIPPLTVEDVKQDENAYLDLLAKKKDLDAQVKAFAGLPPDIEAARAELEALRTQLREATERRDADFEMLVERESPVKVRTFRRA